MCVHCGTVLGEQPTEQGQPDAHHAGRIAVDALDEPIAEAAEGERAGARRGSPVASCASNSSGEVRPKRATVRRTPALAP